MNDADVGGQHAHDQWPGRALDRGVPWAQFQRAVRFQPCRAVGRSTVGTLGRVSADGRGAPILTAEQLALLRENAEAARTTLRVMQRVNRDEGGVR
jgi:hypothetical protein